MISLRYSPSKIFQTNTEDSRVDVEVLLQYPVMETFPKARKHRKSFRPPAAIVNAFSIVYLHVFYVNLQHQVKGKESRTFQI